MHGKHHILGLVNFFFFYIRLQFVVNHMQS